jgi:hypothetical protein
MIYVTPFLQLATDSSIMADADALTTKANFTNIPEHGVIHSIVVIDRDKESANLDVVMFRADYTAAAINAAFLVADSDLSNLIGAVLINTWKAFSDNSVGVATNIGLPYWAPAGKIYLQLVTRATPTYAASTDLLISLSIVH